MFIMKYYELPVGWESVPEEECLIADQVAISGGLVVLQSTMKYQGALMGLCA